MTTEPRIYLNVPYSQKDAAKKQGSQWDATTKQWYLPSQTSTTGFEQWLPVSNFGSKSTAPAKGIAGIGGLYVDLVPATAWNHNLRSILTSSEWKKICTQIYLSTNHTCAICHGYGSTHKVEAHERWQFNPVLQQQTLLRIEPLCPACHQTTHFGLATLRGYQDRSLSRLQYVNGWSKAQTFAHVKAAFLKWEQLSTIANWTLDVQWLHTHIALGPKTQLKLRHTPKGPASS